ncbi:MAG: hypothetical protein ABSE16_06725 [Verrucomicrobiota bacterium]|jgi:hypothetical protein
MAEESNTAPNGGSASKGVPTNVTPAADTRSLFQGPCAGLSASARVIGDIPNVLFRYSKRTFLEYFLFNGLICLHPASYFRDLCLTKGQQDDELGRTSNLDLKRFNITVTPVQGGQPLPLSGLTKVSMRRELKDQYGKWHDYYLFCTSESCEEILYSDFEADSCIRILDPKTFIARLNESCNRQLGECRVFCGRVTYFNSAEPHYEKTNLDLIFRKDQTRYAHQKEYRFAILCERSVRLKEMEYIRLGSIVDIAEYV